jgi:putative pyruvate formate lyase activating enzyme
MPDLKIWAAGRARRYLRMPGYPQAARQAVTEMNRQVGALRLGEDGLARRGLLVRHLVMPGMLEETRAILRYIAEELGTGTYVNLMPSTARPDWSAAPTGMATTRSTGN